MRTIRRLGAAMAITTLVAGVAANCALPPYEAGGSSSSGGGSPSGSGGHAATSSASSSGQGSVSSSKSSSSSGGLDGGDDGGPDCRAVMACTNTDLPDTPCGCHKSFCLDPMCKGDNDATQTQVLFCGPQGKWVTVDTILGCCPHDPLACGAQAACVVGVLLDANKVPLKVKSACQPTSCPAAQLDCSKCFGGQDPCVKFGFPSTNCSTNPMNGDVFCTP